MSEQKKEILELREQVNYLEDRVTGIEQTISRLFDLTERGLENSSKLIALNRDLVSLLKSKGLLKASDKLP